MTIVRKLGLWSFVAILVVLVACGDEEPTPDPATEDPTPVPPTAVPAELKSFAAQVAEYNLGETTILQGHFPEDSPFRHMPVRLDGVIGAPEADGPFPVVLIMHGSHATCPGENEWPCSPEEEHQNYQGFDYLVKALAEAGYVALSINVNAEHTFGFGEAPPTIRTKQFIDANLGELAAASAGESDKFGLDLSGRVDLANMVWIGHSRGGDFTNQIIRESDLHQTASHIGYGPAQGMVLLAPPIISTEVLPAVDVPTALILPACDWDVSLLAGQSLYESARFDADRQNPFTSVYLEHGNHNNFNTMLVPDPIIKDRPDCGEEQMLAPEAQRAFLTQYAADFLRTIYGAPGDADPVRLSLGLDPAAPAPAKLYDHPLQITTLLPATNRMTVMQPQDEDALSSNRLGGEVTFDGLSAVFCPEDYYVPASEPGTELCKRVNFNQPGYPQQIGLTWDSSNAAWRTTLPDSAADLSGYAALLLRAALDPVFEHNAEGESLSFSIELADGDGRRTEVSGLELAFPPGARQPNDHFEGDWFTGHVTMRTVQVPLEAFEGIDISNVAEIALLFDQTPTGALFIADLELIKSGM
jgi:hypothetical protein